MDPNVLHNISYGMYIVSSHRGDMPNGQIVNTAFQITSEPITVAVSINKKNLTHEYIESSGVMSISVLEEGAPLPFIGKFGFRSGRTDAKFSAVKHRILPSGCPVVLDYTLCYLELAVIKSLDCMTHTLFLGKMTASEIVKEGRAMTYEYYHQVKRGTTPETAPTFIRSEETRHGDAQLHKYRCTICNYIYDPLLGDPEAGVTPRTPFEQLPASWVCPVCGASKDQFTVEA